MKDFEAENAMIILATASISNAEIHYFRQTFSGDFEFKWFKLGFWKDRQSILRIKGKIKKRLFRSFRKALF